MYRILLPLLLFVACNHGSVQGVRPVELRGVWLTNVDSDVLKSRQSIAEAMQFLADNHFNLVCPVVWNKAATQYRSGVMARLFDFPIDTVYGARDPLAELIEEAHKRDIAVIAWFEYGFAASHKKIVGHILQKKPEWTARDSQGKPLIKNGFEWMNAYHPEVQQFMLDLITEVVTNYDVDGIQGDDRLPAQPSSGGYSEYTRQLYKAAHQNNEPPRDIMDADWLRWRADHLNEFAARVYQSVKEIDPALIVSWAPSIYPWSYEQYLQDWPAWVHAGNADLIVPQHYRYSIAEYKNTLDSQRPEILGLAETGVPVYPGILMNVQGYVIPEEFLLASIGYNREKGVNGEIFFFYEGLRMNNDRLARALKDTYYSQPADLPFKPRYKNREVVK